MAATREVEGPGVVGETPVLRPGEEFTYNSACDLRSGLGAMTGTYRMHCIGNGREFDVVIPELHLRFPFTAN
jgi:ApaG protein